jgi:quinol monooxygenase YgiN
MLHVVARIELRPGARTRFLDEFRRLEPLVRGEDGCVEYVGVVDVPTAISAQTPVGEHVVLVVERWTDEAALAAHLVAPHMAAYRERVADLVASTTIHVLGAVSGPV